MVAAVRSNPESAAILDNFKQQVRDRNGTIERMQRDIDSLSLKLSVQGEHYKQTVALLDKTVLENDELRKHVAVRRKLPDQRSSVTVKLRVNDKAMVIRCGCGCGCILPESPVVTSLHLHIGFNPNGQIAEWFIRLDRENRDAPGASFADEWAKNASYALQNGGNLNWILDKARYSRDRSAGVPFVWNPDTEHYDPHPIFHHVGSVVDYVAAIIERVRDGKPAWRLTDEERGVPT